MVCNIEREGEAIILLQELEGISACILLQSQAENCFDHWLTRPVEVSWEEDASAPRDIPE